MGALVWLAACVPAQGWQRTDQRACDPQSPPILCLALEDQGSLYELRVGNRVLLPGECMVAAPDQGGGRLGVRVHRSSGERVALRHVRVSAGARTTVRVEGKRSRVRIVDEQTCDGRVPVP